MGEYKPRIVGGHVITPADLERTYKYLLNLERVEAISGEMRAVVEELWPELVHKAAVQIGRVGHRDKSEARLRWVCRSDRRRNKCHQRAGRSAGLLPEAQWQGFVLGVCGAPAQRPDLCSAQVLGETTRTSKTGSVRGLLVVWMSDLRDALDALIPENGLPPVSGMHTDH